MIKLTCCQLGDHFKTKLTFCIDDMEVIDSKFHRENKEQATKQFKTYQLRGNIELHYLLY